MRRFAGSALVARIERATCELVRGGAEAARRREPDALVVELGGGLAAYAGEGSPLDKIAGLGFAGEGEAAAPTADEMAAVERAFAARRTPVRVELASLADP